MKTLKPPIVWLGFAVTLPALSAAEATGEYSSLRPMAEMEAAPTALGEAVLVEKTATVEDVDMASGLVTLKGSEGGMITVQAGPEVNNLAQVKKGDKVTVRYYQSIAVDAIAAGEEKVAPKAEVESTGFRAGSGAKRAGAVGRHQRNTVKILSVDPHKKAIAFRGKDGRYREVSMDAPHLEHYLKELKDGDIAEVVYTEALAVSISAP